MSSAIEDLNKKICEEYTVEISCDRSKMLDIYNKEESELVYWTSDFYQRSFTTNPHNLVSFLKAGIENVLKHYTQYDTFEECIEKNSNVYDYNLVVFRHVKKDYNEPSTEELELWKKGEVDLYAQYTHIKVKINSVLIDAELIERLLIV